MRKSILVMAMLCCIVFVANAETVHESRALEVAQQFIPSPERVAGKIQSRNKENNYKVLYTHHMPESGRVAFYVIGLGEKGFVIVSGDDVANPILGYSYTNSWPVSEAGGVNFPPQITAYLNDMAEQIEQAVEQGVAPSTEWQRVAPRSKTSVSSVSELPDSVGPLVQTTWDQGMYYNAQCPEDGASANGHVLTGCVATVMAQVINYWEYPTRGRGVHSYASEYGMLTVDYSTSQYDYSMMPSALSAASSEAEVAAVAQLMYECGVAVNMDYSVEESSAYDMDARAALVNYFGYSPHISHAERAYFSNEEWDGMLRENIAGGKPVIYSGHGDMDHSFVCDGYNADGYFSFNFGWSGLADGWYLTHAVSPVGSSLNSQQTAIVNIYPEADANVILAQTKGNSTFVVDEPMELYHLLGHNAYEGTVYSNTCNNRLNFVSADASKRLVMDVIDYEDQAVLVYDGETGSLLRRFVAGEMNDMSPMVSNSNSLLVDYQGNMYYSGFCFSISQDSEKRRVSNIVVSVDTTAVHMMWTENGSATRWEVEYGKRGFIIGDGIRQEVSTTQCDIIGLEKFTNYDIYVRSKYSDDSHSVWSKAEAMAMASYWHDRVTEQPEGFVHMENNRVEISSAEGLVWWMKQGGAEDAYLVADLDFGAYRWKPMNLRGGNLYGGGHSIKNVYIHETIQDAGFIAESNVDIYDLQLENIYVKNVGGCTGGLCGRSRKNIINCSVVNGSIFGNDYTGGLLGYTQDGNVQNSYVQADVSGQRWAGLLIGCSANTHIKNNYASGNLELRSYCFTGGIVSYMTDGSLEYGYSVEVPMGVVGYKGGSVISDTSTIVFADSAPVLRQSVEFDGEQVTDLLRALNLYVANENDSTWRLWESGKDGLPMHGEWHKVSCKNVENVRIQNMKQDGVHALQISWDGDDAAEWEIRYRKNGTKDYTYVRATAKQHNLYGLEYPGIYEISLRAICDSEHKSGWSSKVSCVVDEPYWTDVVTSQPVGYEVDADGNVAISTAEGLAWLAVQVNGLHGHTHTSFEGKTIRLTSDISLKGYRWMPIGYYGELGAYNSFMGDFDGGHHTISDLYVRADHSAVGLFGYAMNAVLRNVVVSGQVSSVLNNHGSSLGAPMSSVGGLVGYAYQMIMIDNCHSTVDVEGLSDVGSLCGQIATTEGDRTMIRNCSASGNVKGRGACGGLIGDAYGVELLNSYATGDVLFMDNEWRAEFRGGLVGNCMFSIVENCYSTGEVDATGANSTGKVVGVQYADATLSCLYGQQGVSDELQLIGSISNVVQDSTQFVHTANNNTLLDTIYVEGVAYTELVDVLNAWVKKHSDDVYCLWEMDAESGYPVLGDKYIPLVYLPIDVVASNATIVGDSVIRTRLSWLQKDAPKHWEVLWVEAQQSVDSGRVVRVEENPCVLTDLPVGKPLDFYVRAINQEGDTSGWSRPVSYIPDQLRWTEVVTEQPAGYVEDDRGNIYISSAEGLAWLANESNDLKGMEMRIYENKTIHIMQDIDLSGYRWVAVASSLDVSANRITVKGYGHRIKGLYANELQGRVGLFGYLTNAGIYDLSIDDCDLRGTNQVGALLGGGENVTIKNCQASGSTLAIQTVGGLVGHASSNSVISNSSFVGEVKLRSDYNVINMLEAYIGGLVGSTAQTTISNCYVVCEILSTDKYSGIITGTGGTLDLLTNSYYKDYANPTEVAASGSKEHVSAFVAGENGLTLTIPPYIDGSFRTDLLGALNAWLGVNNADSVLSHWVADTKNVNGGYPVLSRKQYSYVVRFCAEDGTVLQEDTLSLGEIPEYKGETPSKEPTAYDEYVFEGWTPSVEMATADISYMPRFRAETRRYEVNFYNWDGTLLQSNKVEYAGFPTYTGVLPERSSDAQYDYRFTGWNPMLNLVVADIDYTAVYEEVLRSYLVSFCDWDSTLLAIQWVDYGTSAVAPEAPTREGYSFVGWDKDFSFVVGEMVVYAVYEPITAVGEVREERKQARKLIENGTLYLEFPDGKRYTVMGIQQ